MGNKIETSKQIISNEAGSQFLIKNADEMREIANLPHRHNYYTILWSFNADGKHLIDGKTYTFEPHRIFFLSPAQVHQIVPPNPKGLLILFTQDFLLNNTVRLQFMDKLELFSRLGHEPLSVPAASVKKLMVYANEMMDAFRSTDKYKMETIESYLKLFLVECDRQYSRAAAAEHVQNAAELTPLVKRFMEMVEAHFTEWHQVQDYAAALHVTAKYLSEITKGTLKQSPKEFIQDRIIMEAKRMLLFTSRSVKETGFELGFDDPARFSRFFKDCTGRSVLDFTRSVQQ